MDLSQFHTLGRKIVGVGYNYSGLLKQLEMDPPKHPRIFIKTSSSYLDEGKTIKVPEWSSGLWFEVELGVVIGQPLKAARSPEEAMAAVAGYCVTLDMTCKKNLLKARKEGFSWTIAKCFDGSTPTGPYVDKESLGESFDPDNLDIWLEVDGVQRQKGNSREMTWSIGELLSVISRYMTLERGDVVLTGTPAGMDIVKPGQVITAGIQGLGQIRFPVEDE